MPRLTPDQGAVPNHRLDPLQPTSVRPPSIGADGLAHKSGVPNSALDPATYANEGPSSSTPSTRLVLCRAHS